MVSASSIASLLSLEEAYPGMSSFSGVNAITVVVSAIVPTIVKTEKTKIFMGLNLRVSSSSNVSSLSMTKRNLLRHRRTLFSNFESFGIVEQISHYEFLSWYEIK